MFKDLFSTVSNEFLNVKVLMGAFNQEKAFEGAFSTIVKTLLMVRLQLY